MALTKPKVSESKNKSKRAKLSAREQNKAQEPAMPARSKKLLAIWQDEIDNLIGQSFSSLEEAENALIGAVLTKMNIPASELKSAQEFLKALLDENQELRQEFASCLETFDK